MTGSARNSALVPFDFDHRPLDGDETVSINQSINKSIIYLRKIKSKWQ